MNNSIILKQMIRLSALIKDIKEIRCKSNMLFQKSNIFLVNGEVSNELLKMCSDNINNCLYLEKYLRLSVSKACKRLDGFNPKTMDPIDYISCSDVKDKYVDLCRGQKIVATINLTTGFIEELKPEQDNNLGEDKSSVENS